MIPNLLFVVGGFAGIFVLGELVHRTWQVSSEATRKTIHVLAGLLAATLPWLLSFREVILLGISFSVLLVMSQWLNLLPSVHAVNRKTIGEITFPVGLLLMAILFFRENPAAFQLGALILALGDSSASLVGQAFGRREYLIFGTRKTYEGSLTFLFVALVLIIAFAAGVQPITMATLVKTLAVGATLMVIEAVAVRGWDNLVLPVAAATLSIWLGLL